MSITDELRKYAGIFYLFRYKDVREKLDAIADRIDAEHEKAMSRAGQLLADAEKDRDYNYANWQECKQKVLQHNITIDELYARIECLEDELSHCIELPKDADGEYIHFGDVLDQFGTPMTVYSMTDPNPDEGDCMLELIIDGLSDGTWVRARKMRHHHALTVEDVLRGVVTLCHNTWKEGSAFEFYDVDDVMESGNIAEYAAKLQLKEGA